MLASIDIGRRAAKQRAHTGTHLLHAALQKYFPNTKQEGSFVGEDEIRFDFAADILLNDSQLQEIVTRMNEMIYAALPVNTVSMAYADAIKLGAKAFFADTYGEEVRVVTIGEDLKPISLELCGGNHVSQTDHIGAFFLVAHETVASGTKRIVAYTGPRVVEKIKEQESLLREIAQQVAVKSPAMIADKLAKMQSQQEALQSANTSLQHMYLQGWAKTLVANDWGYTMSLADSALQSLSPQDIVQFAKAQFASSRRVVVDEKAGYMAVYDPISNLAKEQAQKRGIQGGGSASFVQGKIVSMPAELLTK